jgi:microcystin-dependent protein
MRARASSPLGGGVDGLTLGAAGGVQTQTLTIAQLPVVTPAGTIGFSGNIKTNIPPVGNIVSVGSGPQRAVADAVVNNADYSTFVGSFSGTSFGSGNAHPIVQPTIVTNYIIYAGA